VVLKLVHAALFMPTAYVLEFQIDDEGQEAVLRKDFDCNVKA